MIKRNDLTKQFELVVQQEIKNYQDSLNSVLQSIRDLKESVEECRQESLENHGLLHSELCTLRIYHENLREQIQRKDKDFENHKNDTESFKNKSFEEIRMASYKSIENQHGLEYCQNFIQDIQGRVDVIEDETQNHSLIISNSLENLKFKLTKDFTRLKEELLALPDNSEKFRVVLESMILSNKVDVDGIMQELRIYKHENMVTQKKIENIYTLIDRLKKGEGNS